ncbi:hypothetical protein DESC_870097 [Desulfosarcina cetonica]|nr:hypothetical protein DESC_870097 [Desulfosarcina cetonica]
MRSGCRIGRRFRGAAPITGHTVPQTTEGFHPGIDHRHHSERILILILHKGHSLFRSSSLSSGGFPPAATVAAVAVGSKPLRRFIRRTAHACHQCLKLFALILEGIVEVFEQFGVSDAFPGHQAAQLGNGGLLIGNRFLQLGAFVDQLLMFALADPAPLMGELGEGLLKVIHGLLPCRGHLTGVVAGRLQTIAALKDLGELGHARKALLHPDRDRIQCILRLGRIEENMAQEVVKLPVHRLSPPSTVGFGPPVIPTDGADV